MHKTCASAAAADPLRKRERKIEFECVCDVYVNQFLPGQGATIQTSGFIVLGQTAKRFMGKELLTVCPGTLSGEPKLLWPCPPINCPAQWRNRHSVLTTYLRSVLEHASIQPTMNISIHQRHQTIRDILKPIHHSLSQANKTAPIYIVSPTVTYWWQCWPWLWEKALYTQVYCRGSSNEVVCSPSLSASPGSHCSRYWELSVCLKISSSSHLWY